MTVHHSAGDIIQVTSQIYAGQQGDRGRGGRAHGWETPAVEIQPHCLEPSAGSFASRFPETKGEAVHMETKEPVGNGTLSLSETSWPGGSRSAWCAQTWISGEIRRGLGGAPLHPALSGPTQGRVPHAGHEPGWCGWLCPNRRGTPTPPGVDTATSCAAVAVPTDPLP